MSLAASFVRTLVVHGYPHSSNNCESIFATSNCTVPCAAFRAFIHNCLVITPKLGILSVVHADTLCTMAWPTAWPRCLLNGLNC